MLRQVTPSMLWVMASWTAETSPSASIAIDGMVSTFHSTIAAWLKPNVCLLTGSRSTIS